MPTRAQQVFGDALASRRVRSVLATDLSTAQLQRIAPELRERAMFSARVQLTEFLQQAADGVSQIAAGVNPAPGEYMDMPTLRLQLKQVLQGLNYEPDAKDAGTIKDLRTDRRLNLVIDTNVKQAQGYGQFIQGQSVAVLDEFPCQELYRLEHRREQRDWKARWRAAGGRLYEGRMIARKDSPIWIEINRFGVPYPPFDFGSGMDVMDVPREEAEHLGVIDPGATIRPQDREFNQDLQVSPDIRDARLRAALMEDVGDVAEFQDGVLKWKN